MTTAACRFCELAFSTEALTFGSVFAIDDGFPVTTGHSLVIPLRHCVDYFELTDQERRDTHLALRTLRDNLLSEGAEGFNVGWNCGEVAGQTVTHAHCHLIPRRGGDTPDPVGGVRGVIPAHQNYRARAGLVAN